MYGVRDMTKDASEALIESDKSSKPPLEANEQSLTLRALLNGLERGGLMTDDSVRHVMAHTSVSSDLHPITQIANCRVADPRGRYKELNEEVLTRWLGQYCGLKFVQVDPLSIDVVAVTQVMSQAFAEKHSILAIEVQADSVIVATSQPYIRAWTYDLEHILRKTVRRVLTSPLDLQRLTTEFYQISHSVAGAAVTSEVRESAPGALENPLEIGKDAQLADANDQHVINIVDWLLQYAFEQHASDIHIEPRGHIANVRFRIDGMLHLVYELPDSVSIAVLSRFKILSHMNLAQRRQPQDGRLRTKRSKGTEVELRLSTLPTALGEKLVIRIFDPDVTQRELLSLGLNPDDNNLWVDLVSQKHGLVLVTGPTGSGKTTTLYSTLKQLALPDVNVCTIEDPVEMVEPAFNQMQVQSSSGLTFAAGAKAILRQDPDIIMIGEIRDFETAQVAVQAALTGHLVFATLHTNDSPSAISRLLDLGIPAYLIRSVLLGVMAQRLVKVLCERCKQVKPLSAKEWESFIHPWRASQIPEQVYEAKGCSECRYSGFVGRQGIYEILSINQHLPHLLDKSLINGDIRQYAIKNGMKTLRVSGAQKVALGLTSIDEVLRVTSTSVLR